MVKEFRVVLAPPPQNGYVPNSDVTGHVVLVTDVAKSGYEAIKVSLRGYAHVQWSRTEGSGDSQRTVTYYSHEDYIDTTAVLWSKASAPGGQIAAGSYQFQFSLRLQANRPLPPTFHGYIGNIVYEVEAVLVRTAALKFNERFVAEVPFTPVVDSNLTSPGVHEPKLLQVQKTLCCLCCASGPISLTARIPRSGLCIGIDAIPFEVDIENGSNRLIRGLQASLVRQGVYFARGGYQNMDSKCILQMNNNTPIQPGSSTSWKPPPMSIPPNIEPSIITSCSIIQLNYYLRVEAEIPRAINPYVEFNLILGNVPSRPLPSSVNSQVISSAYLNPGPNLPDSYPAASPYPALSPPYPAASHSAPQTGKEYLPINP